MRLPDPAYEAHCLGPLAMFCTSGGDEEEAWMPFANGERRISNPR